MATTAVKALSYDVVSVKENKSGTGNMMWNSTTGGVKMENVDMRMLIAAAFALRAPLKDQIVGLPKWTEDDTSIWKPKSMQRTWRLSRS